MQYIECIEKYIDGMHTVHMLFNKSNMQCTVYIEKVVGIHNAYCVC